MPPEEEKNNEGNKQKTKTKKIDDRALKYIIDSTFFFSILENNTVVHISIR